MRSCAGLLLAVMACQPEPTDVVCAAGTEWCELQVRCTGYDPGWPCEERCGGLAPLYTNNEEFCDPALFSQAYDELRRTSCREFEQDGFDAPAVFVEALETCTVSE